MKILLVIALVAVVVALASAGLAMLRRPGAHDQAPRPTHEPDRRMARALAWRVGISVGLFVCVLIAWALGWIEPNAGPLTRPNG
jgi:hypothetical protein